MVREQLHRASDVSGPAAAAAAAAAAVPELARFPVCRILFFARGNADSAEAACFAFTTVLVEEDKTDTAEGPHTSVERTCVPVE